MLEIIAIIALSRYIGRLAKEKNRKPGGYITMTVILWIVMELLGAVIGAIIFGEGIMVYLFAILGAGIGALISIAVAKNLSESVMELETIDSGLKQ